MMREAPKKIFFTLLTKFNKRWSTIMIMLDSSEGGGQNSICPLLPFFCATAARFYVKRYIPRFPVNNKPRKCEDQTNLCRRWKTNGACALNKKFVTR